MSYEKRNRLRQTSTAALIIIFILTMITAGIYDLQFSNMIVNQESGWARVIEDYGELPGIITILTAIFIYHKRKKHSSNSRSLLYGSILLYSAFMLFVYMSYLVLKPLLLTLTPALISGLILTIISVLLVKKLKVSFSDKAFNYARATLFTGLFGFFLIVHPLKLFWGRIRFRNLDLTQSDFTQWFIPNGLTGNESFPSGHAAMGILLITSFIFFRDLKTKSRFIIYGLVLLWGLLVCAGRVVIGAHYLSDVIAGSAAVVFSYLYFINKGKVKNV